MILSYILLKSNINIQHRALQSYSRPPSPSALRKSLTSPLEYPISPHGLDLEKYLPPTPNDFSMTARPAFVDDALGSSADPVIENRQGAVADVSVSGRDAEAAEDTIADGIQPRRTCEQTQHPVAEVLPDSHAPAVVVGAPTVRADADRMFLTFHIGLALDGLALIFHATHLDNSARANP